MMTSRIDSLTLIQTELWQQLELAARQREHEWRTMALATVEHGEAQVRSMLLREVDVAAHELVFFTDSRAPKVAQLRALPIAWAGLGLAAAGLAKAQGGPVDVDASGLQASSRWARLKLTPAAQDYLSPLPPGSPVAQHYEPQRASREHFAVVTAKVLSLDWLELHADGHRRARFGPGSAQWLQP